MLSPFPGEFQRFSLTTKHWNHHPIATTVFGFQVFDLFWALATLHRPNSTLGFWDWMLIIAQTCRAFLKEKNGGSCVEERWAPMNSQIFSKNFQLQWLSLWFGAFVVWIPKGSPKMKGIVIYGYKVGPRIQL